MSVLFTTPQSSQANAFDKQDKTKSRETSGLDRGKTKQTGFPVCYISRLSLQQQRKNNRSEPKQSTRYLYQHKSNFQNHRMNNLQSTFLILSASFPRIAAVFLLGISGITLDIGAF